MADNAFIQQLKGFSLTTAEVLYRLPDHPGILQSYIWQDYDVCPRFPQLQKFLDFWQRSLHGPIFQVRIAHSALIAPAEFKLIGNEFKLQ
jgi:uncharacterized protein Usg